jgi:hypothetical protein
MRRRLSGLLVVAILVLAVPAQALAADVSANGTSSGGYFSTKGTAFNWQHHYHDAGFWETYYSGTQYKSHSWGFETGVEYGEVYGQNLTGPGAYCLI